MVEINAVLFGVLATIFVEMAIGIIFNLVKTNGGHKNGKNRTDR